MFVNAGELRETIEIMEHTESFNEAGYPAPAAKPKLIRKCRAKFTRQSGTEAVKAGADFGTVKVRFLVRYSKTPITRKMFVRYRSLDYEIEFVNDYGDRHRYIEIWAVRDSKEGL